MFTISITRMDAGDIIWGFTVRMNGEELLYSKDYDNEHEAVKDAMLVSMSIDAPVLPVPEDIGEKNG